LSARYADGDADGAFAYFLMFSDSRQRWPARQELPACVTCRPGSQEGHRAKYQLTHLEKTNCLLETKRIGKKIGLFLEVHRRCISIIKKIKTVFKPSL